MQERDRFGRKIRPGSSPEPASAPAATHAPPPQTTHRTSSDRRSVGKWLLLPLVGIAAAAWLWHASHRPDPHYLRARAMVEDYEVSRPEHARNYGRPLYREALDELDRVDPDSVSNGPAKALRARLMRDINAFEKRKQAERQALTHARELKTTREADIRAARIRAVQNPVRSYPECEEQAGGHGHNHDH